VKTPHLSKSTETSLCGWHVLISCDAMLPLCRDIWNCQTWARATRSLWTSEEALLNAHMKGNPGVTSLAAARSRA